jgi:hypothetical protein
VIFQKHSTAIFQGFFNTAGTAICRFIRRLQITVAEAGRHRSMAAD